MKRIVICADGTWNVRDLVDKKTGKRRPTNVTKLARAILPQAADGTPQIVCYLEGVGTGGGLEKFTGGAFGDGMERNIRTLYRFIVYNYQPGDELYFFGFSRGAFTVRTLAGFMNSFGLLEKDDDYYVPEIYSCYEKGIHPGTREWHSAFPKSQGFQQLRFGERDLRTCPPIRFIGVWDTVGALGAPGAGFRFRKKRYQYHDVTLNSSIQNAFHALAIDERRGPFAPDIWTRPVGWSGNLQQAWFAGVHANVGGSYSPDGLANEPLHWIAEQAESLGLELDKEYLAHYRACFNSVLHDSMSFAYKWLWPLVKGPIVRKLGEHRADGECVHQSALDRLGYSDCKYKAGNLLSVIEGSRALRVVNTSRVERGMPC